MDESRKFRFLIPVFWFLGVFFLALYSNQSDFRDFINNVVLALCNDPKAKANSGTAIVSVLIALTAGGFLLLTVGFWISSVTVTVGYLITLRVRAYYRKRHLLAKKDDKPEWLDLNFHWEYTINKQERDDLEKSLGLADHKGEFGSEYLEAAYHHGVRTGKTKDFREFLTRRFAVAWIGANCCIAHLLVLPFNICVIGFSGFLWWIASLILIIPVVCNLLLARRFVRVATRLSLVSTVSPDGG